MNFEIIFARNENWVLGKDGKLPWNCKEDLALFYELTKDSVVIAGRKTIQTLPKLQGRKVFCLCHKVPIIDNNDCKLFSYFGTALIEAQKISKKVFLIGGAETIKNVLTNHEHYCDKIHMSVVKDTSSGDATLHISLFCGWEINSEKKYESFTYQTLVKNRDNFEKQYLTLLADVALFGDKRDTRNGIVKSVFFKNMSFDLRKGFPIITTKKMFFRGIVEELLFFLRGETDSKVLEKKGVNIWKGNTERKFLDNNGFKDRKEGMMGPMYGYQWRFFGAEYDKESGKPKTVGVDQLKYIIDTIENDKNSRRIIMTDFNPSQAFDGVLFPCHSIIVQFYVYENYLDMYCYNRSQDLFLGTPFNISSSALLLSIIAKRTGLTPRYLHIGMGDVHLYEEHLELINIQRDRIPYSLPQLILPEINLFENIKTEDIVLQNYLSHPPIKANMVS